MAYNRAPQEHAFIKIEKDLKAEKIPAVVLLCGREDYLTDHYARVLTNRYVNPATRQLDLTTLNPAEVTATAVETAAETISLMSERRVIYLPGLINKHGKLPKQLDKEKQMEGLTDYMKRIPEGSLLLITCERPVTTGDYKQQSDGKKLKALSSAVAKAKGAVYDFEPLDQNQLKGFVSKRFINAGKNCSPGAFRRIVFESGYGSKYTDYDLFALENDLKKIIASAGSRDYITEDDLNGVLTENPENNVFRMLDAISRGRKDQALIYLNTLLEDGEAEFGILSNIVKQVELMLTARELQDEGQPRAKAIAYIKKEERTQEFRAKNAADAASRFPTNRLKAMLLSAYEVEEHIKTGLMDGRLALEFFIGKA